MKRAEVAWAFARIGWRALLACIAACGQGASGNAPTPSGAIDFGLELAPGVRVTQAAYTISGPNGFYSAGNVAVGESADLVVPVGTLPIGAEYQLSLTAPASDGQMVCEGNSEFDVTDGNPKSVNVHLNCAVPSGDVALSATLNICPTIDSLGASPQDVKLGGVIALTSSAHDSDSSPSSLSYKWTINGAPLPPQVQPNLNFACSQAGTFNFALTVSDGDITPGCADTLLVTAHCSAP